MFWAHQRKDGRLEKLPADRKGVKRVNFSRGRASWGQPPFTLPWWGCLPFVEAPCSLPSPFVAIPLTPSPFVGLSPHPSWKYLPYWTVWCISPSFGVVCFGIELTWTLDWFHKSLSKLLQYFQFGNTSNPFNFAGLSSVPLHPLWGHRRGSGHHLRLILQPQPP